MLSYLAASATYITSVYRELDAAGRAYLRNGDPRPLLRIASEQNVPGDAGPVKEFSEGLYIASICNDYPQLWDISSPVRSRAAQYDAAVRQVAPHRSGRVRPVHDRRVARLPLDRVPELHRWAPPSNWVPPVPDPPDYPDVPVLVLVGDLDSITSPEGSRIVADNFPEQHVRRGGEHGPRGGPRRLLAVRVGHRRALRRPGRRRRRHVLRPAVQRGAHRRGVPRRLADVTPARGRRVTGAAARWSPPPCRPSAT